MKLSNKFTHFYSIIGVFYTIVCEVLNFMLILHSNVKDID